MTAFRSLIAGIATALLVCSGAASASGLAGSLNTHGLASVDTPMADASATAHAKAGVGLDTPDVDVPQLAADVRGDADAALDAAADGDVHATLDAAANAQARAEAHADVPDVEPPQAHVEATTGADAEVDTSFLAWLRARVGAALDALVSLAVHAGGEVEGRASDAVADVRGEASARADATLDAAMDTTTSVWGVANGVDAQAHVDAAASAVGRLG